MNQKESFQIKILSITHSHNVQNVLFELGYRWPLSKQSVLDAYPDSYIITETNGNIGWSMYMCSDPDCPITTLEKLQLELEKNKNIKHDLSNIVVKCPNVATKFYITELALEAGLIKKNDVLYANRNDFIAYKDYPYLTYSDTLGSIVAESNSNSIFNNKKEVSVGEFVNILLDIIKEKSKVVTVVLNDLYSARFIPGGDVTVGCTTFQAEKIKYFIEKYTKKS